MNRKLLAVYAISISVIAAAFIVRWGLTDNLCIRGARSRSLPREVLSPGDTIRLHPGGSDILAECDLAPPRSVQWESDDSTILRVSPDGLVRAVGAGTATITARARFTSASHGFTVRHDK